MSVTADELDQGLAETAASESLWTKGLYKFRRDRVGMWSLAVVLLYVGVALGVLRVADRARGNFKPALALHHVVRWVVPVRLGLAAGTLPVDGHRERATAGRRISGVPRRVGPDVAFAGSACIAGPLGSSVPSYLTFRSSNAYCWEGGRAVGRAGNSSTTASTAQTAT